MIRHRMWWAGVAAALGALAGCAGEQIGTAGPNEPGPDASLASLRPEALTGEPADENAAGWMLDEQARMFDELERLRAAEAEANRPPPREPPAAEPAPEPAPEAMVVAASEPEPATPEEATPAPTPRERLESLTREIASILRDEGSSDPYALALRLAALRGVAGMNDGDLDVVLEGLPEDEREAVRAIVGVLAAGGDDPAGLAEALREQSERLNEARPIRIRHVALCSRVEGFGRYTELGSGTFVAGSPMRMIVYTEVDHFDQARHTGSGGSTPEPAGWEVRLSQELQLYHEADGLLAWRHPEETSVYRSRTRLRDYFLVNQIELPRTLTVGAYRLKVVMRDLKDGSVDEAILPIRVVADPRLATGG